MWRLVIYWTLRWPKIQWFKLRRSFAERSGSRQTSWMCRSCWRPRKMKSWKRRGRKRRRRKRRRRKRRRRKWEGGWAGPAPRRAQWATWWADAWHQGRRECCWLWAAEARPFAVFHRALHCWDFSFEGHPELAAGRRRLWTDHWLCAHPRHAQHSHGNTSLRQKFCHIVAIAFPRRQHVPWAGGQADGCSCAVGRPCWGKPFVQFHVHLWCEGSAAGPEGWLGCQSVEEACAFGCGQLQKSDSRPLAGPSRVSWLHSRTRNRSEPCYVWACWVKTVAFHAFVPAARQGKTSRRIACSGPRTSAWSMTVATLLLLIRCPKSWPKPWKAWMAFPSGRSPFAGGSFPRSSGRSLWIQNFRGA